MAMKWYLQACPVCGGDMHDDLQDPGWVMCFMCARSFPASEVLSVNDRGPVSLVGSEVRAPVAGPQLGRREQVETRAA